ncbi:response regulator transcription factor [Vallitalea okinawensis]|uniref:response regulator transcription factor n=1 Tax=Vallitalea okinawensis TaxID=2078660 RepID=UPI000CFCF396|nr:response regulator [Vallitalea okinawensis]
MLKVLIVDDNSLIRKSIIARMNWDELDMKVIGEAENGKEALDRIMTFHPDIIVTDIKMPIADGFSIIEKTKEILPNLQYIIISGYDDFQYAKKAITYNVINYILKPINDEELTEALMTASKNIRHFDHLAKKETTLDMMLNENSRRNIEEAFKSYFNNEMSFIQLNQTIQFNEWVFDQPFVFCFTLNLVKPYSRKAFEMSVKEIEAIESLTEDLLTHSKCRFIPINKNIFLGIINMPTDYVLTHHTMTHLANEINAIIHVEDQSAKLFYGFSRTLLTEDLNQAFKETMDVMYQRYAQVNELNVYYSTDYNIKTNTFIPKEELIVALKLQLYAEAKTIIKSTLVNLENNPTVIKNTISELFDMIDEHIKQFTSLDLVNQFNKEFFILQFYNLQQILDTINNLLDQLSHEKLDINLRALVVDYINTHFTNNLTLRSLGTLFHVNHIYLGQLIKKETGTSFNKYLNNLRINYAKDLIHKNRSIVLKDLAYNLGYTDAHYFTKVFKNHTSMTPTEYKNSFLKP